MCLFIEVRPASGADALLAEHACELLSDEADWDAEAWDLTPAGVGHLTAKLTEVFAENAGPLFVTALWDGDQSSRDVELSREDLIAVVNSNDLGNKVTYRVRA